VDQGKQAAALFRQLEESLLDAGVRGSPDKLTELLADEFVEFGGSGRVFDKQGIIRSLGEEEAASAPLPVREISDFSLRSASSELVLLTYRLVRRSLADGQESHSLRSSVWKLIGGKWRMIFHQGTPTSSVPD
jgi:hypothetical protein